MVFRRPENSEDITTPEFHDVDLGIPLRQQAFRDTRHSGDIHQILHTATSIEVATESNVIRADHLERVQNVGHANRFTGTRLATKQTM